MEPVAEPARLRIGLAAVKNAASFEERLETVERTLADAAARQVAIVCFPETYLPGLRGMDFAVAPVDQARQVAALERVRASAERYRVAVVIGMEWTGATGIHNVAFVISRAGKVEGYQAKNQIPVSEEPFYVADGCRRMFQVDGVPFGITICHEGWRYPEATRWPAVRGAKIVFHPQMTGSDLTGPMIERWGDVNSPYYEKAMIARGVENTIYFASVNYAMRYQDSATSLIGPEGECLAIVPYGQEKLLVYDLDLTLATGHCALRYNPALYPAT
jgi:predicted amidohydrolase